MARTLSAEHLLQDAAWLEGLARTLAHDRDDADDLVQEAWITAWQRQPDASRPMRGWLTKVVRDLAGMKRRSEHRRAAREAITHDAQTPASPDELLERMRLHRRLVDLVLELDEPYRSTIIAHFVEDRTSASIAQSLGIPAGTVRKRLWEGLSRLRAGLDAQTEHRRRRAPAVLAFVKGGILVAKPTKIVIAVVAALLFVTTAIVAMFVHPRAHESQTHASPAGQSTTAIASNARPAGHVDTAGVDANVASPEAHTAKRTAMLEAIAKARSHRAAAPVGATTAASDNSTSTTLDIVDRTGDTSDWEKRALGTLNSLLGQCYDLARAEDPAFAGTIAVRFTILGEPSVGGLLDHVEILDEDTSITQQTFRDCATEQLYALELDPPPDGVTVERELSLRF